MTSLSTKISDLPPTSKADENGLLPLSIADEHTVKISMGQLRETLNFENAFESVGEGLTETEKGQNFYVYADTTKNYVLAWKNQGTGAIAIVDGDGNQVIYPTTVAIKNLGPLLDSGGAGKVLMDDGTTVQSNLDFSNLQKSAQMKSNVAITAYDSTSTLLYNWILDPNGGVRGQDSNAVQTMAFDEKNRFIYAMFETTTLNTCSVIYRMPMDVGQKMTKPSWAADGDIRVGHQGLAIENNKSGETYIWATKRGNNTVSPDPQSGSKMIRFPVDNVPNYSTATGAVNEWSGRNGLYFENVQEFILWPLENTIQNSQATLSYDQRFVLSKMNYGDNYIKIRVFDIEILTSGGSGDYSEKFLYEFTVPRSTYDSDRGVELQGMASDGTHIYFYGGRGDASPDAALNIQIYTLDGKYITGNKVSNIGYNDQLLMDPTATIFEDESLSFLTLNGSKTLVIEIAGGKSGVRSHWLYALGVNIGNFRATETRPAIIADASSNSLSVAAQRTQVLSLGSVNESGKMVQNLKISGSKSVLGNGENFSDGLLVEESLNTVGFADVQLQGNLSAMRRVNSGAPLRFYFAKSRSLDRLGVSPVVSGDYILDIATICDDGFANWSSSGGVMSAGIAFRVTGAVTQGIVPSSINFSTMNQSGVFSGRWQLNQEGHYIPLTTDVYNVGSASARTLAVYTVKVMYTATVGDYYGTGSPEGVLTSGIGSTYRRGDGAAGTCFYVKETGTGNTGWIGK